MRISLLLPIALVGCGTVEPGGVVGIEPDEAVVSSTLAVLSPEPLVELVEDPRGQLGVDPICGPLLEAGTWTGEAPLAQVRETWTADCSTAPGVEISGQLEIVQGPAGSWLAGDRAVIRRDGLVEFSLDGAIQVQEQGDLLLLDVAASWCGAGGPSCQEDPASGPAPMDLSFSIFPAANYPGAYDVTVSGAVGAGDVLVSVDGAWSVDDAACPVEPSSGAIALRSGARHALELDGAERCDGCAAWAVQGLTAQGLTTPGYCGMDL